MTAITIRAAIAMTVLLMSNAALAGQAARTGATLPDVRPTLQWISVVLLSGDMEAAAAAADEIPPAVRRAMADVQDFLPYKSYRLVDAALLGPPTGTGSTARLSRTVDASGRNIAAQTLQASMRVIGGGAAPVVHGPLTLSFDLSEVRPGQDARNLIRTTVTLDVGETVVVGTSRLSGTALIALLTAVPATR